MKIGIVGYGNLGKAIEESLIHTKESEGIAVFTRRDTSEVSTHGAKVYSLSKIYEFRGKLDCLLISVGSSGNFSDFAVKLAENFNTVDSFDSHSKIKEHLNLMNLAAKRGGKLSVVSAGWDPGIFSLFRNLMRAVMPRSEISSFWGRGISQGHSEAIRRIPGVKYAVQYTVPKSFAKEAALGGEKIENTRASHVRECFVVADESARSFIEREIKNIPEYFKGYETTVNFISEEEFFLYHNSKHHKGEVIAFQKNEAGNRALARLILELDSNPRFTASVMLAYARAVKRLSKEGRTGAFSVLDIPVNYLFDNDEECFPLI